MTPPRVGLLSRRTRVYMEGGTKVGDVGGDAIDSLEGAGMLEIASLALDDRIFTDEGQWDEIDANN